jgi:hypothetical protein
MRGYYRNTTSYWASHASSQEHTMHHAINGFEDTLKALYRKWVRENALKVV